MITAMCFTKGFIYKEVRYGWKDKKLYRLPFTRNKRSFGLKEIPFYVFKTTIVFNIQRDKMTILKLKERTKNIDWKINIITEDYTPF